MTAQLPIEPVAWYSAKADDCITATKKASRMKVQQWDAEHYDTPLYAAQPPQDERGQGLSDDALRSLIGGGLDSSDEAFIAYGRRVLAAAQLTACNFCLDQAREAVPAQVQLAEQVGEPSDEQIIRLAYKMLVTWDQDTIAFARAVLALATPAPLQPVSAEARLRDAHVCLGFFASVIKSGEPWTETCQRMYDAALPPPVHPDEPGKGEV